MNYFCAIGRESNVMNCTNHLVGQISQSNRSRYENLTSVKAGSFFVPSPPTPTELLLCGGDPWEWPEGRSATEMKSHDCLHTRLVDFKKDSLYSLKQRVRFGPVY